MALLFCLNQDLQDSRIFRIFFYLIPSKIFLLPYLGVLACVFLNYYTVYQEIIGVLFPRRPLEKWGLMDIWG